MALNHLLYLRSRSPQLAQRALYRLLRLFWAAIGHYIYLQQTSHLDAYRKRERERERVRPERVLMPMLMLSFASRQLVFCARVCIAGTHCASA